MTTTAEGTGRTAAAAETAEAAALRLVHETKRGPAVRIPKGATHLKVTTVSGKTTTVAVEDVTKGENVLHGAGPFKRIEAVRTKGKGAKAQTENLGAVTAKGGDAGDRTGGKATKASGKAQGGPIVGEGGHVHPPEGEKTAGEGKEPKAKASGGDGKQGKWNGHSISSVLRWMGNDGWKAKAAAAVCAAYGWKQADPSIRLQIASGRQGIRGAIAGLTNEQEKELRAKRDKVVTAS